MDLLVLVAGDVVITPTGRSPICYINISGPATRPLVYGLLRTVHGASSQVSSGNALFSLLGFFGIYTVLSILFLFLLYEQLARGPEPEPAV